MRVLLLGYQSIGHEALSFLLRRKENVVGVLTHRDTPGENIWWPSVADLARRSGIPVDYDLNIEKFAPDIVLSAYYRHVVPMSMLRVLPHGGFNLHGSLLPKYRGRAPANWALVNGESVTGMTLHEMTSRPDAGPIVDQEPVAIHPRETIATLYPKLIQAARTILERSWPHGLDRRRPQDESQATTYRGRRPEDGEIHWDWPVRRIDCLIRAVTHPYPGAFAWMRGKKVYIWEGRPACGAGFVVPCADGGFEILRGQIEGEPEMSGNELKERLG